MHKQWFARLRVVEDEDCGLVKTAISGMSEEEANEDFCLNIMHHSVFERSKPRINISPKGDFFTAMKGRMVDGHANRCAKYMKQHPKSGLKLSLQSKDILLEDLEDQLSFREQFEAAEKNGTLPQEEKEFLELWRKNNPGE
jgi:hypothetical protein